MSSITPCRNVVSDRFPVASFVVRVPADRCFEIAWATDPQLLDPNGADARTVDNFYGTRSSGLLRAPAGETTVILPPTQLRRFAGKNRLYYALGTYAEPRGSDPHFSAYGAAKEVPFIQIAGDFTGRGLDRSGLKGASEEYGRGHAPLSWGADLLRAAPAASQGYDDGHGEPWGTSYGGRSRRATQQEYGFVVDPRSAVRARAAHADDYDGEEHPVDAPPERRFEDPVDDEYGEEYGESYDEPGHAEDLGLRGEPDGLAEPPATSAYGGRSDEPPGLEEPPASSFGAESYGGHGGVSADEPPGLEEPPTAAAEPRGVIYGGAAADPDGYEDATEADRGRYGRPQAPVAARPLAPADMARVARPVFRSLGGLDAYARTTVDQRGLVWGIGGFNQRDGSLREVIDAALRRDRAWYGARSRFASVFGSRNEAISAYAQRRAPHEWLDLVDGVPLSSGQWVESFRNAGAQHAAPDALAPERDPFKVAQNEIAIRRHLMPALPFCRDLGLVSDRCLAMVLDRNLEMGADAARRWITSALAGVQQADPRSLARALAESAAAERQPFANRLRALLDSADLDDTVYTLVDAQ